MGKKFSLTGEDFGEDLQRVAHKSVLLIEKHMDNINTDRNYKATDGELKMLDKSCGVLANYTRLRATDKSYDTAKIGFMTVLYQNPKELERRARKAVPAFFEQ
jgi:hypothetical protein